MYHINRGVVQQRLRGDAYLIMLLGSSVQVSLAGCEFVGWGSLGSSCLNFYRSYDYIRNPHLIYLL